jgi:hypothetical protein
MVPTTLWWAETNHPGNNRSAKQIKTQFISFFFSLTSLKRANVHLDTGNCERQRLDRIGCQSAETGKFNVFHLTNVFWQQSQSLVGKIAKKK